MIPNSIVEVLNIGDGEVDRSESEMDDVIKNIALLGLNNEDQISQFFIRYNLAGVISNKNIELLDLCFPDNEILETTEWAKDVFDLQEQFLCLSSGEGEGFILFSKDNYKIYDVSISQFDDLFNDKVKPAWDSFFDLIDWYLKK